ncbi:sterol 3-beta-glucosyltransferase UGT80A2-like isoform X3 [Lycium barbarum]|uniref:sterol 3-beta-glucosyltransferase UGT80A2-like isoform X3 n=1 Tax=Lycium barbarum TaxID=112863 RepID=UPI00293EFA92|nr:sterol 3-beta-glucosyltransferase UGT80A2-like isoform X3 [Lycium barbarum]
MEKNNGFDRRLSDSCEVPVDFEVEIHEENGNETKKETNGDTINVEGSASENCAGDSVKNVEKPVEKLEPGTSQPVKAVGRRKQNQNRALGLLTAKLFDDKLPLRKKENGHRVRLATHANFKEFVLGAGLEFYPLGGDPKVLAAYMVKNKGFLPSGPSEILIQRNQIKDIVFSLLPACVDPDPESNVPFKVNAIIANPPGYGHMHVAEALKVPLHIFFTMPWTPTSEFPHPLSRVKQSVGYRLSYQVVDGLIWLGIRDVINDFRKKKLKLRPITYLSNSNSFNPDVPYGYIWSPHLVPKPKDWGPKIDVVGFCFLDLASSYEPPESLVKWLEDGEKPIYIGFGSLPVQEPEKMTEIIVQALEITGQRGIINKGWGGLGSLKQPKDFVYLLDNCPHDWLFLQCAAVVHHGGAGTTAAGLKAACPTTVVPFFGDQPFWGERVHARGVGPAPIPVDEFSLEKLVTAIQFMLDPKVKERALELAKAMENEDGVTGAVKAFYKHFPRESLEPKPEVAPRPHHFFSLRRCFGHSPTSV